MKLEAGKWYECLEEIPEQYFGLGGKYKCNLDGYLMNDARNNVKVTYPEYFKEFDITKEDLHHVSHYEQDRKISPFDVIEDWGLDFFTGNVIKYIARLWRKRDLDLSPEEKAIEDINKAIVYLEREKELITHKMFK